jgi:3-deoxy-D-arabino-heptulosonate 7-phosphate (DAHP) synthase class II
VAGITAEIAQAKLEMWLAADDAVAKGQAYQLQDGTGGRTLTRADAAEIRRNIEFWNGKAIALSNGRRGPRVRGVVPL